ncbi:DNA-binding MarR family transcriptional regulator [Agromyces terreus]|uniref:DNA-binding MarR family transcriptional regulator n=1 Tax=Agromyces terreus TaxID=424795 RepID=A0A9X2H2R3_9MICO|nr:winged helix DNA-binding protein [Agromyces terreus]MCP2369782.1 DNA-binding MarR family transcriptional regulator [Agromyces terreus]
MPHEDLVRFAEAAHRDLATLLMAASRAVNEQALAALDPEGSSGIRLAHVPLIAELEPGGTRLVTLAGRLGITRQAVAALVRDLTEAGVTTVTSDPSDGRAQLVRLTDLGAAFCGRAADYLEQREQRWRGEYGDEALDAVRAVLAGFVGTTPAG